jgi:excisionase family DNA binding protein
MRSEALISDEPLLLRGTEVAKLLGCSRAMAYRMMQKGLIPTIHLGAGKSVRVPRLALLEWIKARTAQPLHEGGATEFRPLQ